MNEYQETEILHGTGELGKSRSQKKRESTALQRIGEELAAQAPATLKEFDLPAELSEALADWRTIKKHEARRRQMQFIGRIVRELYEENEEVIEKIASRLDSLNIQRQQDAGQFHHLEELRERLVNDDSFNQALEEIRTLHPQAQEKQLRHLAQAARAEKGNNKPAKSYRELFRYLRSLQE